MDAWDSSLSPGHACDDHVIIMCLTTAMTHNHLIVVVSSCNHVGHAGVRGHGLMSCGQLCSDHVSVMSYVHTLRPNFRLRSLTS